MIVAFIIGSAHSGVNDISLVNSEEEDQVPYSPQSNGDNGLNKGTEECSSSCS